MSVKVDAPGIYQMSKEDYLADPCPEPSLSHSTAVTLLQQSPLHAWSQSRRLNPNWQERKRTEELDRGTALHSLFLEGEDVMERIECGQDKNGVYGYRTSEEKANRDAAYAAGRVPVKPDEHERMMTLLEILKRRVADVDDPRRPFTLGLPEQVLVWRDHGVWCRARLDWLSADRLYVDDLKTAASANPGRGFGQFGRAFWAYGYDVQAAFYRRGVAAVFPGTSPTVRHVAFELSRPNALSVCQLGAAGKAVAEAKVTNALNIWAECLASNRWPGYPRFAVELEPPDYEIAAVEAQEGF